MAVLVKYEAACLALAEAHSVDEVKDIHDKAVAMRTYAIQAKNVDLECMAAEVRERAERRLGEMLAAEKAAGHLKVGRPSKENAASDAVFSRVRLADLGVDEHLSRRSQKKASISEAAFEAMVAGMRQQIVERADKSAQRSANAEKKAKAKADHAARVHDGCDVDDLHALVADGRKFKAILIDRHGSSSRARTRARAVPPPSITPPRALTRSRRCRSRNSRTKTASCSCGWSIGARNGRSN